jgi:hypothetical protein
MSIDNLLALCPSTVRSTRTTPVSLPEPNLPPKTPGAPPVPLSQALAERTAEDRARANKAQARERTSNGYPFWTKREIVARIEADFDFATECLLVVYQRQTDDEVAEKDTKYKNKRGFMSSHAVHGTRIAELILAGEVLSDEDRGRVAAMAVRYGKQLASHFRQMRLRENPELAAQAAKFGVGAL